MPAGQPSTTQPMAGPWLSPKVVTRKRWPKVLNDMGCTGWRFGTPLAGRGQMAPVRYAKQWLSSQGRRGILGINHMGKKLAPVHLGEVLSEDFLRPKNLSAYAVARACGVPRTRIE